MARSAAAVGRSCIIRARGRRIALLPSFLALGFAARVALAAPLSASEVDAIVRQAAVAIDDTTEVIAVTDRPGHVLAVWEKAGASAADRDRAISLARTGAFFSNNQAPLSSRTVRFISGIHFPPGVRNTQAAALYGIENTNRGCRLTDAYEPGKAFPRSLALDGTPGPGITTGKADLFDSDSAAVNGGGVPIFKPSATPGQIGDVAGGVGVVVGIPSAASARVVHDSLRRAEYAAFCGVGNPASSCGASGPLAVFLPPITRADRIQLDGIRLPFVKNKKRPKGSSPGSFTGFYIVGPLAGRPAPDEWLVDPAPSAKLSAGEVRGIVERCIERADRTRAAIRLPFGSRTRMVIAVSDLAGNILGLYRMPDSTIFSVDVAVTKARNVIFFSGKTRLSADLPGVPPRTAVTSRTIEFGAEPLFPSGIDGTSPGPFFPLFLYDSMHSCTQGSQSPNPNQSGIVFFPGALPLYRDGLMVGGLGVSGDGVEQDDYVTAAGAEGFEAPGSIRADRVIIDGVRLPYLKFPRNPEE